MAFGLVLQIPSQQFSRGWKWHVLGTLFLWKVEVLEKYFKKNHITKKANDCLVYIAQNEGMSRKKCLDNIVLWFYSYYMGAALKENDVRRMVNKLLPRNVPKVLPSPVVSFLRKKGVQKGIGSYPTIVRRGL